MDLADRLASRVQLSTDGHKPYLHAVPRAFGYNKIAHGVIVKLYGVERSEKTGKYSPDKVTGMRKSVVRGRPNKKKISTSYVERQNLTMRMSMRRFARLSNAFSKKVENHMHAISLHYMYYNFGRIHQTLKVTPAMAAKVTDHVWTLEEIAGLIPEQVAKKRGPNKQRNSK